jgi:aminopeptidase N
MKKFLVLTYILITPLIASSQSVTDSAWKKIYRAASTQINDLVHTKLEVKFDYSKSYLYGKAWLTLKPHFYATDSLLLDAKGMDIKEVSIVVAGKKAPLKYTYDSKELNIRLNKTYAGGEQYTVFVDYTSKPNEVKVKSSAAINNAKGLYFINPTGEEKNKHIEIWTQGETEGSSVWMPTIDKPNQKTTQEIFMTVPSKYVTLSNGLLINQKKNTDGTRTDYWKMDLPHAPYLFFMGVGDYAIIKDQYKGKEVSYYVEKEYAPVARKIFGNTPEMMKFFSDKLGVEFVWPKYAQMVARDYVSGAMENTTATLHGEGAYQNARQLTDENAWEGTIAHELFHQWFGDLVTTESWSNLTVNESLADYSQTLWKEYKYGKDAGDDENQQGLDNYILSPTDAAKDLVRYRYESREDMFDVVTYLKGGRILHMLRNYVGDAAFYKSLNTYLVANKFKTAEAAHLRLAFEEVTGQDLNWFWNQWYYGSGHPVLKIDYLYDDGAGLAKVIIAQTQKTGKLFRLPLAIDIYEGNDKKRYKVWVENESDTLTFKYSKRPDLINVDADKVLLAVKDDNKTSANYLHQLTYAPLYLDRREALDYFAEKKSSNLKLGLKDKYAPLRRMTISRLEATKLGKDPETIQAIHDMAQHENDKLTMAEAIKFLAQTEDIKYQSLYEANLNDSSYSVAGAALEGLILLKPEQGFELAQKYRNDARGDLATVVAIEIMKNGDLSDAEYLISKYSEMPLSMEKILSTPLFAEYLQKIPDLAHVKKGIDPILKFRNSIPEEYRTFIDPAIRTALDALGKAKGQEVTDYITDGWK